MDHQYQKAVKHTLELLNCDGIDRIRTVLMACVLFVAFDLQAGNYFRACKHLEQGLRLRQGRMQKVILQDDPGKTPLDLIGNTLARVDLQVMAYNGFQATYPFEKTVFGEQVPVIESDVFFHSLAEARRAIVDLTRAAMRLSRTFFSQGLDGGPDQGATAICGAPQEHKAKCETNLMQWEVAFKALHARIVSASGNGKFKNACCMLSIYHKLVQMILTASEKGCETVWDGFIANFIHLISLVEEMSFDEPTDHRPASRGMTVSFELGSVLPLFVTAIKCRDPWARRRAIALLYEADRCEGLWHSEGAARVAESVLLIEEEEARRATRLPRILSSADVPDHVRVTAVQITGKLKDRKLSIRCWRRESASDQSHVVDVGTVHF